MSHSSCYKDSNLEWIKSVIIKNPLSEWKNDDIRSGKTQAHWISNFHQTVLQKLKLQSRLRFKSLGSVTFLNISKEVSYAYHIKF